jgi:hypothetical protein
VAKTRAGSSVIGEPSRRAGSRRKPTRSRPRAAPTSNWPIGTDVVGGSFGVERHGVELEAFTEHGQQLFETSDGWSLVAVLDAADRRLPRTGTQGEFTLRETVGSTSLPQQRSRVHREPSIAGP